MRPTAMLGDPPSAQRSRKPLGLHRSPVAASWKAWSAFVLVVIFAASSCGGTGTVAASFGVNGLVAPPGERHVSPRLAGATLTGGRLDVAAWRGRVVVVNFWGSWCPPCRKEQPELERAARATFGRGVRFLGIDTRDNLGAARAYVRGFHVTYPSLFDKTGALGLSFKALLPRAVPFTFVLDRRGRVAARFVGATSFQPLINTIEQVLRTPG